jgi:hypothetical protein
LKVCNPVMTIAASTTRTHHVALELTDQEVKELGDSVRELQSRMPNWASNPQHLFDLGKVADRALNGEFVAPVA